MTQDATEQIPGNPDERAEIALAKLRQDCPQSWQAIVERVVAQRGSASGHVATDEEPAISFVPGGPW
ncbi:hypothetical protein WDZ92_51100 [Nostoc sp. NIES-2111]